MNAGERWKRLKESVKENVRFCQQQKKANKKYQASTHGWKMAETTGRGILDEMARLEKED